VYSLAVSCNEHVWDLSFACAGSARTKCAIPQRIGEPSSVQSLHVITSLHALSCRIAYMRPIFCTVLSVFIRISFFSRSFFQKPIKFLDCVILRPDVLGESTPATVLSAALITWFIRSAMLSSCEESNVVLMFEKLLFWFVIRIFAIKLSVK